MKLYLGGPMRGYPLFNYQAFQDACLYLERLGHVVVSPHDIDLEEGYISAEWRCAKELRCADGGWFPTTRIFTKVELTDEFTMERALRRDIVEIAHADGVAFLPGWVNSQGCQIEDKVREWFGLPRFVVHPFIQFREDVAAYKGVRPRGTDGPALFGQAA
jgi:hypothetical protein